MIVEFVKPVPLTVIVVGPLPANTVVGETELIAGTGEGVGAGEEDEEPEPAQPITRHKTKKQIAEIHNLLALYGIARIVASG